MQEDKQEDNATGHKRSMTLKVPKFYQHKMRIIWKRTKTAFLPVITKEVSGNSCAWAHDVWPHYADIGPKSAHII